ncbi:helix-turn-helix transcriptional regulator [Actinocorallia aurea]
MPAQSQSISSPTIRAFSNELRARREAAALSKTELARLLSYSPQYIGQVEESKNWPSRKFSEVCDSQFGTDGLFLRLWNILDETRNAVALPPGFPEYLERERQANTIRIYSALLIAGLFQTQKTIEGIVRGTADEKTADELVQRRLQRQRDIFEQQDVPEIFLLLHGSALEQNIGDRGAQREQLHHLITMAAHPHIMIQLIPRGSGYHPGLAGSFTLLGFGDGSQAAYIESAGMGIFVEDQARTATFATRYDKIRGHAYTERESLSRLQKLMEEL